MNVRKRRSGGNGMSTRKQKPVAKNPQSDTPSHTLPSSTHTRENRYYVGIDIGYREHVACCIPYATFKTGEERHLWRKARCLHFPSTATGFATLLNYLREIGAAASQSMILLEPTGGYYGASLVKYLQDHQFTVWQIDNVAVKDYREKVFGGQTKTDQIDARLMARMGYLHESVGEEFSIIAVNKGADSVQLFRPLIKDRWRLRTEQTRCKVQLQQLVALTFPELKTIFTSGTANPTCRALLARFPTPSDFMKAPEQEVREALIAARNRSHLGKVQTIRESAKTSAGVPASSQTLWRQQWLLDRLAALEQSTESLEENIHRSLDVHPYTPILLSIPGFSPIMAATVIATVGDINRFKKSSCCKAMLGFCPRQDQSGSSVDSSSLTIKGSRDTRRVLWQMVMLLISPKYPPTAFRHYYQRLVARGMPKMKAIGHTCGKLSSVIYACLKQNKPYDGAAHQESLGMKAPEQSVSLSNDQIGATLPSAFGEEQDGPLGASSIGSA